MVNVLMYNEWKESDDYKIQQWFINKKIEIEKWFNTDLLDLEYDYFEFNSSNLYNVYIAELFINENLYQYKLQFMIDSDKYTDGVIETITLILHGFDKNTQKDLGILQRDDVNESDINSDLLLELINEFKMEYIDDIDNTI